MTPDYAQHIKAAAGQALAIGVIGWLSRRAFGKSLTPDPSQSGDALATFMATMVVARVIAVWVLEEIEKKKTKI